MDLDEIFSRLAPIGATTRVVLNFGYNQKRCSGMKANLLGGLGTRFGTAKHLNIW